VANISDPVAVRHPDMPGEVHVVSRRQLPSLERRGWVEVKSPAAKKAVEQTAPEGADNTPSKEASS
jgi:hypothetical protein